MLFCSHDVIGPIGVSSFASSSKDTSAERSERKKPPDFNNALQAATASGQVLGITVSFSVTSAGQLL
jgi:hypothetical protein